MRVNFKKSLPELYIPTSFIDTKLYVGSACLLRYVGPGESKSNGWSLGFKIKDVMIRLNSDTMGIMIHGWRYDTRAIRVRYDMIQ